MNLVAWSDVYKPKIHGGLGINKICTTNKAPLSKWLWRFGLERDSLWSQVIACKYSTISDWKVESSTCPYGCGY